MAPMDAGSASLALNATVPSDRVRIRCPTYPVFWGTPPCGPKPTIGGAQLRVSSIVQSDRPAGFHRQSPSSRTRRPMSSVWLGKSRRPDDPTETRLHGRRPRVGTSRDRRKDGNLQLPWARHHPVAPCRWLHSRVGMVLPTIWLEEGIAGIRDRKWRSPRGHDGDGDLAGTRR